MIDYQTFNRNVRFVESLELYHHKCTWPRNKTHFSVIMYVG